MHAQRINCVTLALLLPLDFKLLNTKFCCDLINSVQQAERSSDDLQYTMLNITPKRKSCLATAMQTQGERDIAPTHS